VSANASSSYSIIAAIGVIGLVIEETRQTVSSSTSSPASGSRWPYAAR
jgi:hypothetical protein